MQRIQADAFHSDPRRARSPEWDFGVHWRNGPTSWPLWRLSYVCLTGELFAAELGGADVLLIATLPTVGDYPFGKGHDAWRDYNAAQPVEHLLHGWAELPYEDRTLQTIERMVGEPYLSNVTRGLEQPNAADRLTQAIKEARVGET